MEKFNAVLITFKLSGIPSNYQIDQPLYDVSFRKLKEGGFFDFVKRKVNEYVRAVDPKVYYELLEPNSDVLHRVIVAFNVSLNLSQSVLSFIGDEIRTHLISNDSRYEIDTKKFSYYVQCDLFPFPYDKPEGETTLKVTIKRGERYTLDMYLDKDLSSKEVAEIKSKLMKDLPGRIPDKLIEISYDGDKKVLSVELEASQDVILDKNIITSSDILAVSVKETPSDLSMGYTQSYYLGKEFFEIANKFIGYGSELKIAIGGSAVAVVPVLKLVAIILGIVFAIGVLTYQTIRFIAVNPKARETIEKITFAVSFVAIAIISAVVLAILVPVLGGGERG